MKKINFTKTVASGNDFVIIEKNSLSAIRYPCLAGRQALSAIAKMICDRKYGAGADGLLVLERIKAANLSMRVFNADGSEAEMCGNGARCVALYSAREQRTENREQRKISIETKAGIIEARVDDDFVKIKLTDPKDIKLDIPLKINNRNLRVSFINTGVPHAVIFVEGLDKIDVTNIGRQIRYHKKFAPAGTNVDFVEILNSNSIKLRTYERGVEDETLACGTGSVASVLLSAICYPCLAGRQALSANQVNAHIRSGEALKVYFNKIGAGFEDVWLEGKAKIVYKGEYYV